jgi:hypothetical protein
MSKFSFYFDNFMVITDCLEDVRVVSIGGWHSTVRLRAISRFASRVYQNNIYSL